MQEVTTGLCPKSGDRERKGQIANILDFAIRMISVVTAQLSCCNANVAIDSTEMTVML